MIDIGATVKLTYIAFDTQGYSSLFFEGDFSNEDQIQVSSEMGRQLLDQMGAEFSIMLVPKDDQETLAVASRLMEES